MIFGVRFWLRVLAVRIQQCAHRLARAIFGQIK
jgi:hypothetical protein